MCDSPPGIEAVKDLKASGTSHEEKGVIDEEELERLAMEALLQEAKRAKTRAEQVGAMGWQKCELPKTNKRFLSNVVKGAMASNRKRQKLEPPDISPKSSHRKHRKDIARVVKGGVSERRRSSDQKRK